VPFVIGTSASTASRPAFVAIASRPSCWDEMEGNKPVIWDNRKRKYFLEIDWTKCANQYPQNASKKDMDAGRKAGHDERVLACFRLCSR
jgi:hypothetical protein